MPYERSAGNRGPNFLRATRCRNPRKIGRSFLRVGPATVRAAERALAWGGISKFGPQIKRMRSPWSEQSMGGELRPNRRECIAYNERCPTNDPLGTEGPIFFEPPGAGTPA